MGQSRRPNTTDEFVGYPLHLLSLPSFGTAWNLTCSGPLCGRIKPKEVLMTAPLLVSTTSAKAQNLKMAQGVDVQLGRDRDDRDRRRRNDSDVTIGVGPGGVTVGPRQNCRMVTTTVERDDGRTITRKERRCD